ncbi:MAG: hypothetical protein LC687_04240 [Actinobacteria bacterium]|nr:hypothetical protein [Actinomycetota bacterium]
MDGTTEYGSPHHPREEPANGEVGETDGRSLRHQFLTFSIDQSRLHFLIPAESHQTQNPFGQDVP